MNRERGFWSNNLFCRSPANSEFIYVNISFHTYLILVLQGQIWKQEVLCYSQIQTHSNKKAAHLLHKISCINHLLINCRSSPFILLLIITKIPSGFRKIVRISGFYIFSINFLFYTACIPESKFYQNPILRLSYFVPCLIPPVI